MKNKNSLRLLNRMIDHALSEISITTPYTVIVSDNDEEYLDVDTWIRIKILNEKIAVPTLTGELRLVDVQTYLVRTKSRNLDHWGRWEHHYSSSNTEAAAAAVLNLYYQQQIKYAIEEFQDAEDDVKAERERF